MSKKISMYDNKMNELNELISFLREEIARLNMMNDELKQINRINSLMIESLLVIFKKKGIITSDEFVDTYTNIYDIYLKNLKKMEKNNEKKIIDDFLMQSDDYANS